MGRPRGTTIIQPGFKAGLWKVLRRADDYVSPSGKVRPAWRCKCMGCGRTFTVLGGTIGKSSNGCEDCRKHRKLDRDLKVIKFKEDNPHMSLADIAGRFNLSATRVNFILNRGREYVESRLKKDYSAKYVHGETPARVRTEYPNPIVVRHSKRDRKVLACKLRHPTWSATKIGHKFGLSAKRIRDVLRKEGYEKDK